MNKAEKYKETIEAILCSNVLTVSGKTEAILDLLTDFAEKEAVGFIEWRKKYALKMIINRRKNKGVYPDWWEDDRKCYEEYQKFKDNQDKP